MADLKPTLRFTVGARVDAVIGTTGRGTIIKAERERGRKPYIVQMDDGRICYFHEVLNAQSRPQYPLVAVEEK